MCVLGIVDADAYARLLDDIIDKIIKKEIDANGDVLYRCPTLLLAYCVTLLSGG